MTYLFDGYNWVVRIEKGDELVSSLTELVKQENIRGAWISGLGGAMRVELGFYELEKKQYSWKTFDELLEIISLQGNVSWTDDAPILHLHGTFSDARMQAIGGHVKSLVVGGTCELLLHAIQKDLTRSQDDDIGLKLLNL